MPMFPSLVEPIRQQLADAEAELKRLEADRKAKKTEIRSLNKMLRQANGDSAQRAQKGAKS